MSVSTGPKVLLVSAGVGAGHVQAAGALLEALQTRAPDLAVEHLEILSLTPRIFRAYYNGGYVLSVTKFPWLYGLGFALSDGPHRPDRGLGERCRLWAERQWLGRFRRHVLDARPPLIVHTHLLAPALIGRLLRAGSLRARQMVVVTDIQVHRYWYARDVDHWFVPAEPSAEALARWGIGPDRVTVSGMPVFAKWTDPLDRDRIHADWRLPRDRPIVVLSGGTEFVCGPVVPIVRDLLAAAPRACLVVLAGRNKRLLGRLSRLPGAADGRLVPVPFTRRAHELLEVCSLMVTKAGGVTTAECLAKGTPMVLLRPVPGQEAGNAAHMAHVGAAVVTRNAGQAVAEVARLLADPGALADMAAAARAAFRPGTRIITDRILQTLESSP